MSSHTASAQTTLQEAVCFSGVGLHSGCNVALTIQPAPPDTGIVFRRTDLGGFPIEAHFSNVANVSYATSLMKKGVLISTVEHVLAAVRGSGVDNAFIDLDDMEVPILDGSALPYVEAIARVGLRPQERERKCLRIRREVRHELGDKSLVATPSPGLEITYVIDFPHPLIGRLERTFSVTPDVFKSELAPCRTFGFVREFEQLKENGLIRGGSLENAIVLTETGIVNPEVLRFPDEFVRHKAMDFMGDLSLAGMEVRGRFHAVKAGHGVHAALVRKILSHPDNYSVDVA